MLDLSIIIIAYNMKRELPRTLQSLLSPYQQNLQSTSYEILVVDNHSTDGVDHKALESLSPFIKVTKSNYKHVSPVFAVNQAVKDSKGKNLCIILDGARLVTPNMIYWGLKALKSNENAFVTPLAWHLGPDHQTRSQALGYSAFKEDKLLDSIDWLNNGYKLFDISALAGANPTGFFGPVNESCCTFITRKFFDLLNGYDENFTSPGGGFVNLDFFTRATVDLKAPLIVLLGEGSFHQIHGGVASNAKDPAKTGQFFSEEYHKIKNTTYKHPKTDILYMGELSEPAIKWINYQKQMPSAAANKIFSLKKLYKTLKEKIAP